MLQACFFCFAHTPDLLRPEKIYQRAHTLSQRITPPRALLTVVEIYRESKWASEASGITSFSKVRKRAKNLYCLIDKGMVKGKKKRK